MISLIPRLSLPRSRPDWNDQQRNRTRIQIQIVPFHFHRQHGHRGIACPWTFSSPDVVLVLLWSKEIQGECNSFVSY